MHSTTTERRHRGPRPLLRVLAATVAVALLAACGASAGSDDDPAAPTGAEPVVLQKASLASGDPIPVPGGRSALTLTGELSGANKRDSVELDVATMNAMGLVRVEVYEPWARERLAFRGVELADVLDIAGVRPSASSVHMTALDDYEVELTMAEIRAGGILVATATASGNGRPLSVANGGPTRIVFTDGTTAGIAHEQWIWSLKTIEVR
jgi:hypothetical protein